MIAMLPVAEHAAVLLGAQIRDARRKKRWSAAELGERAGVSRVTVGLAEAGSPNVSIGNVLNLATLAGLDLFGIEDPHEIARARKRGEEHLALLPKRVHKLRNTDTDDDFNF